MSDDEKVPPTLEGDDLALWRRYFRCAFKGWMLRGMLGTPEAVTDECARTADCMLVEDRRRRARETLQS